MRCTGLKVLTLALLVVHLGCGPNEHMVAGQVSGEGMTPTENELLGVVQRIYESGQARDMDALASFHLYGPRFSRLEQDGTRQDAELNRASEVEFFTAENLDFQFEIVDPKVDLFSDRFAVVTYWLRYSCFWQGYELESIDAVTFVMVKDGGAWKIAHEHFAHLPGQPVMSERPE